VELSSLKLFHFKAIKKKAFFFSQETVNLCVQLNPWTNWMRCTFMMETSCFNQTIDLNIDLVQKPSDRNIQSNVVRS
jgi:hypothetical protein